MDGVPVWVLPPHSAEALGRFLNDGAVGVGIESGVTVDASAGDLAALRALSPKPTGRPTRALVAFARFASDVQAGDQIGVLVQAGRNLLLGEVAGGLRVLARRRSADPPAQRAVGPVRAAHGGRPAVCAPGRPAALPGAVGGRRDTTRHERALAARSTA